MDQIDSAYKVLSISHQCRLIGISSEEYGCPAIFNTDQGRQFTSDVFIKVLVDYSIQISKGGKERALDNIRIECLWRSLKYEDIYLKRYETMKDLKAGINASSTTTLLLILSSKIGQADVLVVTLTHN